MIERFADAEHGGFFTTAADHRAGLRAPKDLEDSPIPSGSSAAAFGLLRLARLSGEVEYERHALGVLRLLAPIAGRHPLAFGHVLQALDFYLAPRARGGDRRAGDDPGAAALAQVVRGGIRPHVVLAGGAARRRAAAGGPRRRSTAAPPPTCASTSSARRRSPSADGARGARC